MVFKRLFWNSSTGRAAIPCSTKKGGCSQWCRSTFFQRQTPQAHFAPGFHASSGLGASQNGRHGALLKQAFNLVLAPAGSSSCPCFPASSSAKMSLSSKSLPRRLNPTRPAPRARPWLQHRPWLELSWKAAVPGL